MTVVEEEIRSTPAILRQTLETVKGQRAALAPLLQGPAVYLGCGSSYCVGLAAAALHEAARGLPAQGILASEYRPRPAWAHLAISRTGQTTELVEAMGRARRAGARMALICGAAPSPAASEADGSLVLGFAAERSVIQTRFVTAATLALRLLVGDPAEAEASASLPDRLEAALADFDPAPLARFEQIVYLGRGWRLGMALAAALNLQETALVSCSGYQTLDYRHGPLACADERSLVWCFDPPDDAISAAVLDDVRRTGATVRCIDADPLTSLAQAQLVAVQRATSTGIDPEAPRNLSRAIVLPAIGR
jgi:fructoselysine-6-P-deglycase FrlB-like protein